MPNNRKPTLSRITSTCRASRQNPCRGCGGKKWPCYYREVEETGATIWYCGPAEEQFCYDRQGAELSKREAYFGDRREDGWQPPAKRSPDGRPADARKALPAELLDRVYRIVLQACPLSAEHRQQLLARPGMTPEIVEAESYATARRIDGISLMTNGIPGAAQVPGMPDPGLGGGFRIVPGALLIPVRDSVGRIVGIRQRVVDEDGSRTYLHLPGSVPAIHHPVAVRGGARP